MLGGGHATPCAAATIAGMHCLLRNDHFVAALTMHVSNVSVYGDVVCNGRL